MMSLLSSGVMFASLNTGIDCGPGDHRLVDVRARHVAQATGAYLPRVRAPPEPAKLWHIAQLTRNSSPPLATSPPSPEVYCASGMAGPGASEAT